MKSIQQKWNEKNRDKVRVSQKRYRTKHRALVTERTRLWAHTNDGWKSCRNTQFKRKYGITLEQYEAMLKDQENACLICGRKNNDDNRRLYVDHCHKTKKVRGLLCYRCNTGIGLFNDDSNLVAKAVYYLDEAIAKAEGK